MYLHDVLFTMVAFFSEILGTISGFGSSTFLVPTAILFEKIHLVLALTAILHCFSNSTKIVLFRQHVQWRLFLIMAIPSIAFTGLGAMLTKNISVEMFQKVLGLLLVIISVAMTYGKRFYGILPTKSAIALSSLSGFLTGLLGTGGALRGFVLATMGLEKNAFVLLSSGIDIGGDFIRAGIYLRNGYMDWSQWFYLPLLGVAAYCGARIGKAVLQKIDQSLFEKIVAVFVFLSGLLMLVQPFPH